jgi:hypothetical protein
MDLGGQRILQRLLFRDIHTVCQQLQGRQEHFEIVGQYLLGLEPGSLARL